MSRQRQLNALLFELQTARTALDRARILARAWRSVRDLSASDRRLLARYAAFDGAEELLESLSRRGGGATPALLLRVLGSAEEDDGGAVGRLVASLRSGAPVSELAVEAVDAAVGLLEEEPPHEGAPAGPPRATAAPDGSAAEAAAVTAAMAALSEVGRQATEAAAGPGEGERVGRAEAPAADLVAGVTAVGEGPPAVPRAVLLAEWDEVGSTAAPEVPALAEAGRSRREPDRPEGSAEVGLRQETESVLDRFASLRSRMAGRPAPSELRDLALSFPDGWQRRRAVTRLLQSDALGSLDEGLELVATLEREVDRRWCLGLLLERRPVSAAALAKLLEGVASPGARRRLAAMARSG